uniref:Uncharacterized protein n=1 Tax=Anopheles maculatus TaxID=74869 RepID=A0A182SS87_9DIPT
SRLSHFTLFSETWFVAWVPSSVATVHPVCVADRYGTICALRYVIRYKSIIVFSACLGIVIWSLLLWTESLAALQVVQVLYGAYMASEVAYYTYIYAKISREKYQQVTGNTRAAILLGRFLSGVISQILVSTGAMNVRDLNYITLGSK